MFYIFLALVTMLVVDSTMAKDPRRTIVLDEMIANATRLENRVQGDPMVTVITLLITRLRSISPSDVEMLANPDRAEDNELVDDVLTANNIINQMLSATDEELFRKPTNIGALVLASNDIAEYVKQHQRSNLTTDGQF